MVQEIKENTPLEEYANKYNINDLTSEDIVKLMSVPYIVKDIIEAFGITEKEFNTIKESKGISNVILEDIIRNIDTILTYIDLQERYVSNAIRKKVVDNLIQSFTVSIPKRKFYIKRLSEINFSREKVINDLVDKDIDQEYRLNSLADILPQIDRMTQVFLEQEKDFLLNYNHKKMYNQLLAEKQNGKKFSREDLTYDILFELSIIENTPDSLIADIFDMKKTQVKYMRQKNDLVNTLDIKMKNYPESIIYYMEKNNKRMEGTSNYECEKIVNTFIESYYGSKSLSQNEELNHNIIINVDGKDLKYHVTFSDEKYIVSTKGKKREGNGSHHNYKKENETKRLHGKIGEQIALKAEKMRLIDIGLEYLIDDVQLVAQVNEEVTFDGLGYDLISFNEDKERIFIEVKASFGNNDKPFFISAKEIELMQSLKKEHDCKYCLIYYVLIDDHNVTIKRIYQSDFSDLKLIPVLYKIG